MSLSTWNLKLQNDNKRLATNLGLKKRVTQIPVRYEYEQTEEGPEMEHQIYVKVDREFNIKQVADGPF